jgi:hypothetical protein
MVKKATSEVKSELWREMVEALVEGFSEGERWRWWCRNSVEENGGGVGDVKLMNTNEHVLASSYV